jgi:hypothetical protein
MKHRILIEFESDKLPDDFTDQVAGRVYTINGIHKTECTVMLLDTPNQRMDFLGKFCTSCGDENPRCQCWNDD